MNDKRTMSDTDEELVDTLLAISVVSKRLARKLSILAARSETTEGGKIDAQNERNVCNHQQIETMCRCNQLCG